MSYFLSSYSIPPCLLAFLFFYFTTCIFPFSPAVILQRTVFLSHLQFILQHIVVILHTAYSFYLSPAVILKRLVLHSHLSSSYLQCTVFISHLQPSYNVKFPFLSCRHPTYSVQFHFSPAVILQRIVFLSYLLSPYIQRIVFLSPLSSSYLQCTVFISHLPSSGSAIMFLFSCWKKGSISSSLNSVHICFLQCTVHKYAFNQKKLYQQEDDKINNPGLLHNDLTLGIFTPISCLDDVYIKGTFPQDQTWQEAIGRKGYYYSPNYLVGRCYCKLNKEFISNSQTDTSFVLKC